MVGAGDVVASEDLIIQLKASPAVGKAILAAMCLEWWTPFPTSDSECEDASDNSEDASDSETYDDGEAHEIATITYKYAIKRLGWEFPDHRFSHSDPPDRTQMMTEEHSQPCPCGEGRMGIWPWLLQPLQLGFCACQPSYDLRIAWVDTCLGPDLSEYYSARHRYCNICPVPRADLDRIAQYRAHTERVN